MGGRDDEIVPTVSLHVDDHESSVYGSERSIVRPVVWHGYYVAVFSFLHAE